MLRWCCSACMKGTASVVIICLAIACTNQHDLFLKAARCGKTEEIEDKPADHWYTAHSKYKISLLSLNTKQSKADVSLLQQ